jgi:hypothetical protein
MTWTRSMAHGLASGWPVHGFTVDSTVACGRGSPELGLTATPMHGGSPALEQWRKERVGSPSRASLGRGRWCGNWAIAAKKRWWWCSVRAVLGPRKKRKRAGQGAVEDDGALPFYRGRGGGGREWQVAVVNWRLHGCHYLVWRGGGYYS